jgi:hypothetical protein
MYDSVDDVDDGEIGKGIMTNVASTVLAYLNYTIDNNPKGENLKGIDAVRSIYTCVLNRSNHAKSCSGKTNEELVAMRSFL